MTVERYLDFLAGADHAALRGMIDGARWRRDDRPGLRHAAISAEWAGFAPFLALAAERHELFTAPPYEVQVTRMVEGESFANHHDAHYSHEEDDPENDVPLTTFVYYLGDHRTFDGGRLLTGGEAIEPTDNSLVLFDGLTDHAIERITGTGAQRLTVNGCYKRRP